MRPCAEKSCKIRGFATRKSHEAYELVEHAKFCKAGGLAMHETVLSAREISLQKTAKRCQNRQSSHFRNFWAKDVMRPRVYARETAVIKNNGRISRIVF